MRPKGVVVTLPETKPVGLAVEAKKILAERKARLDADRARKAAVPVPNYKCYPDAFKGYDPKTGKWLDGKHHKVPPCKVCGGLLHPNENHVCDGFKPKFVEMTAERHELWEAKREDIRASNYNRPKKCLGCHQVIEGEGDDGLDNARWHEEHCCADMPRGRHWYTDYDPIVGDNDGHECYEDEPEDGYCEGDDDGYDCD